MFAGWGVLFCVFVVLGFRVGAVWSCFGNYVWGGFAVERCVLIVCCIAFVQELVLLGAFGWVVWCAGLYVGFFVVALVVIWCIGFPVGLISVLGWLG